MLPRNSLINTYGEAPAYHGGDPTLQIGDPAMHYGAMSGPGFGYASLWDASELIVNFTKLCIACDDGTTRRFGLQDWSLSVSVKDRVALVSVERNGKLLEDVYLSRGACENMDCLGDQDAILAGTARLPLIAQLGLGGVLLFAIYDLCAELLGLPFVKLPVHPVQIGAADLLLLYGWRAWRSMVVFELLYEHVKIIGQYLARTRYD